MDDQKPSLPPAGWYPDPSEIGRQRYWNGAEWGFQAPAAPQAPAHGLIGRGTARVGERPQVTFGEAIRYGFQQYAKSTGRATRAEYWWFALFLFLVAIVLAVVDSILGTGSLLGNLWTLATLLPSVGVGCRRLRDAGCSPWNLLWGLVPVIGTIIVIVKLCRPSVPVRPLPSGRVGASGARVVR